jgi:PH (Pleckstrin Homology) domain-containing protein
MPPINPSQDLYFPSKRDEWIEALILLGILVSLAGGIAALVVTGASWTEMVLVGILLLGMDSLMLWVLYGTGYTITSDRLLIRCGPMSFGVRLESIEFIFPTRSPWSSPACSLDRLRIVYGLSQQSIMISPEDKSGFLSALVQQCPTLVVLEERVRKKTGASSSVIVPTIQPQVTA